jgi:hypothetical protein
MYLIKDISDKRFWCLRNLCSTYLSCFIAFALLVPAARAQYCVSLCGAVTDPQSNLISGVTVTFVSTETNEQQVSVSSGEDIYHFNARPPPHFLIAAETARFRKQVISDQQAIPDQPNAHNMQLQVAGTTETTVNRALAPGLDTDTISPGESIGSNRIQHLPLYNHDIFQMEQLAPTVFGDGSHRSGRSGDSNNNLGKQPYATEQSFCCSAPTSDYPKRLYETAKYMPNATTITKLGINNHPTIGQHFSVMDLSFNPTTIPKLLDTKYQLPHSNFASIGYRRGQPLNLLEQSKYNGIARDRGMAQSPYGNFKDYNSNIGTGNLDALIITLKDRFAHHFILKVPHALATAMDENSGPFNLTRPWPLPRWLHIEPGLQRTNSVGPVSDRKALLH